MSVAAPEMRITTEPVLSADASLVMGQESGMILFAKNPKIKRPIASLTKLMTALVTLEDTSLEKTYQVPAEAAAIEGSSMQLVTGEKIQGAGLLKGLLINSGNDAAMTLALNIDKTVADFVERMNIRAHFLGMEDTHFANPHGLDHLDNYSTAFDIALLAKQLLQYQFVRDTTQKITDSVTDISGNFTHPLETTNELLKTTYPVFGLKTGTTEAAGQCFVGLIRLDGKNYIIVILGSENRFKDTKALIWALRNRDTST